MSHADSAGRSQDYEKEVVRDELQSSIGLEVDGRGIEAVESQQNTEAVSTPTVWKKHRIALSIVALICVIGGVVGGAVGGTVGKAHHKATATSPDGSAPSVTTSSARYVHWSALVGIAQMLDIRNPSRKE